MKQPAASDATKTSASSEASPPPKVETPWNGEISRDWLKGIRWRGIGPANMGGRITDLAINEEDPSTWWAATGGGGLIKTTNNGISFQHQFDKETTVSIGAVAVSKSDPKIVWVGTGENNPRNSVSYGDGVYKSTDGGKSWKNMGLKKSFQIGEVVIHPTDPNTVYVGALGRLYGSNEERGLFKTTDGGVTWERCFYIDDRTGIIDLQLHPKLPSVPVRCLDRWLPVTKLHAMLQKHTGLPIIPIESVPMPDGRYRTIAHDPIYFPPDATEREIAQKCWDFFEPQVRSQPEAWLWAYKHWRFVPKNADVAYPSYALQRDRFDNLLDGVVADMAPEGDDTV